MAGSCYWMAPVCFIPFFVFICILSFLWSQLLMLFRKSSRNIITEVKSIFGLWVVYSTNSSNMNLPITTKELSWYIELLWKNWIEWIWSEEKQGWKILIVCWYQAMFFTATRGAPPLKNYGSWSEHLIDFISLCLQVNPKNRPSARMLLQVRVFLWILFWLFNSHNSPDSLTLSLYSSASIPSATAKISIQYIKKQNGGCFHQSNFAWWRLVVNKLLTLFVFVKIDISNQWKKFLRRYWIRNGSNIIANECGVDFEQTYPNTFWSTFTI